MKELKAVICKEIERPQTTVPVPRHIIAPMTLCEEIKDVDLATLSENIKDEIRRNGYVVVEDPELALRILKIKLKENEYVKIFIEGQ